MSVANRSALPLRAGDSGEGVRDVQRRLAALGYDLAGDTPGEYRDGTTAAVRAFQERRGLRVDGICGRQTWSSLVEAGFRLGEDRLIYLRAPMLRGDDVADLQQALGALGFDAGRVDGIFGPHTAEALLRFQRNAGLTTDGICGPDTVDALRRFVGRAGEGPTVAHIREAENLRDAPRRLRDRRLAVGETGGLGALADAVGKALIDIGAVVAVLHHPDESVQATEANAFAAEAFLGLAVRDAAGCSASYYQAERFESVGGRRLAQLVLQEVPGELLGDQHPPTGMRLPMLRETRMPAVLCELGPPAVVVEHNSELVHAFTRALVRWVHAPLES